MANIFDWIVSFWWSVVLSFAAGSFIMSLRFHNIIKKEEERGGEEYGERATSRIGRNAMAFMITSGIVLVAVLAYWIVFEVFGLTLGA